MGFENIKIPQVRTSPAHFLVDKSVFLKGTKYPKGIAKPTKNSIFVEKDEKIILLEHGVGYNGLWSKIFKLNKETNAYTDVGFVLADKIIHILPKDKLLTLNNSPENLPDPLEMRKDWTTEEPNQILEDLRRGKIYIHFDTGIEKLAPETVTWADQTQGWKFLTEEQKINRKAELYLKDLTRKSMIKALSMILKEYGKKNDEEYIINLLDNYYFFAEAEDFYFPTRKCSSFRILISVSKRLLFSEDIENALSADDYPNGEGLTDEDLDDPWQEPASENAEDSNPPPVYVTIDFSDRVDYEKKFASIQLLLGFFIPIHISRTWVIEPEQNFELTSEVYKSKQLKDKIDEFIFKNVSDYEISKQIVFKENGFLGVSKFWTGQVKLTVETNSLQIVKIEYYTTSGKRVPLNLYVQQFLKNPELNNPTIINYLLKIDNFDITKFKGGDLSSYLPDRQLSNFMIDNHYPAITNMYAEPLDLAACINNFEKRRKRLSDMKLPDFQKQFREWIKKEVVGSDKKQGDFIGKFVAGGVKELEEDPMFAIFFRPIVPPDDTTALEKVAFYINYLKDFNSTAIIQELFKCIAQLFDQDDVSNFLEQSEVIKKGIEEALFATICNPWLGKIQDAIENFDPSTFMPKLPLLNPNADLGKMLEDYFAKLLSKLIVTAIKETIIRLLQMCLQNRNQGLPADGSLTGALGDSNFDNGAPDDLDAAINDALANAGSNPEFANALNDFNNPAADSGKLLSNFFEDISCFLSSKELCSLLYGKSVNSEVLIAVKNLIKIKYPFLKSKYSTNESIYRLFAALGTGIDLSICSYLDTVPFRTPTNCFCDDGSVENLRTVLLGDKGLTDELLKDLLDGIKERQKKNLDDLLDFLNGKQIEDITNDLPSVLCKKAPDGSVIPPEIDLRPSMDSFKSLLDSMVADVYNNFDRESKVWYRSSYLVDPNKVEINIGGTRIEMPNPSMGPMVYIDLDTGKLSPIETSDEDKEKMKDRKNYSTQIPSYVFKSTLDSINIQDGKFKATLDSSVPQELEINFVNQSLRESISSAQDIFNQFIKAIASSLVIYKNPRDPSGKSMSALLDNEESLSATDKQWILKSFLPKMKLFDGIMRDFLNEQSTDTAQLLQEFSKIDNVSVTEADKANSRYLSENGASIYAFVMEFLIQESNKTFFERMLSALESKLFSKKNDPDMTGLYNTIWPDTTDTKYLTNAWSNENETGVLDSYLKIKNAYQYVQAAQTNFPKYTINGSVGTSIGPSPDQLKDDNLYDFYEFHVDKNINKYINLGRYEEYGNELLEYITNVLEQPRQNVYDKKQLFKNTIFNSPNSDNIFNIIENNIFDQIKNNVKDNLFTKNYLKSALKPVYQDNDPTKDKIGDEIINTYIEYTSFLTLFLEQTQREKICKIRPHFLDIDNLKEDAANTRSGLFLCVDKLVGEIVASNQEVNVDEIANQETSETQDVMVMMMLKLATRLYAADFILRGYCLFGYYDPQSLIGDQLFIDFLEASVEYEIRSVDSTFWNIFVEFLVKIYALNEGLSQEDKNSLTPSFKRDLVRKFFEEEITTHTLPKLSKRIAENTNEAFKSAEVEIGSTKINLKYLSDDILNTNTENFRIEERPTGVYAIFPGEGQELTTFTIKMTNIVKKENDKDVDMQLTILVKNNNKPVSEKNIRLIDNTLFGSLQSRTDKLGVATFIIKADKESKLWQNIKDVQIGSDITNLFSGDVSAAGSNPLLAVAARGLTGEDITPELATIREDLEILLFNGDKQKFISDDKFKFMFEYMFPSKRYLSILHIINALSTTTRRRTADVFRDTKNCIRKTTKLIITGGNQMLVNPNNLQDVAAADTAFDLIGFLLEALIMAPLYIAKGFFEVVDPNVLVASFSYKLSKPFVPDLPSYLIPAVGLGVLPWTGLFPTIGVFYYILGLWALGDSNEEKKQAQELAKSLLNGILSDEQTAQSCDDVGKNRDSVLIDKERGRYLLPGTI